MMKLFGTLTFLGLVMALTATAQMTPVLDTSGQEVRRGVRYYIKPAITDNGGPFTLIDRNGTCPWYVGQQNVSTGGISVTFDPYVEGENVVRESRNFRVSFSDDNDPCDDATTWKVGDREVETQRRLIVTEDLDDEEDEEEKKKPENYFYVYKNETSGNVNELYRLRWCPSEFCALCRYECGFVGVLFENGKRLLALNDSASALPVVFERL
ncbi:hypothetical protein UlMin_028193 [Ulmus minor]